MTLALYGKSRKRQGGLLLAALLAIIGAAVGGLLLVGTAFAHHLGPDIKSPTCQDQSWRIRISTGSWDEWREAVIDQQSGSTPVGLTFSPFVYHGPDTYIINASGTGAVHSAGRVRQYTGIWQNNKAVQDVSNASTTTLTASGGNFNSFSVGDVILIDKDDHSGPEQEELMKVTGKPDSTHLTVTRGYGGTTATAHTGTESIYRWARDLYDSGGDANNPHTVTWNLDFDPADCNGKIQVHKYIWTGSKWQNQGVGQDPTFTFRVRTGSANGSEALNGTAHGGQLDLIPSPKSEVWVTEDAQPGYTLAGFTVPDPGNSKCEFGDDFNGPFTSSAHIPAASWSGDSGTLHVCAYNLAPRTVTIAKVRTHAGASAGSTETFGGSISNGSVTSWSQSTPASDGTSSTNYSLDQQSHAIGETLTAGQTTAGWKLIGFKKISGKNASTGCTTTESDYTANASSITVPADGNDYTICVLNKYDPTVYLPDLIATKTNNVGGSMTQGGSFIWTIVLKNQGNANAVFAANSQVFVDNLPAGPTYSNFTLSLDAGVTGGVSCTSSNPFSCTADGGVTIAPNGTITLTVTVAPAANFVGNLTNPAADGKCKVDANSLVTESNENNNTCSDTVVVNAPQVVYRTVTVCKVMDDNSNGIPTEGGTFGFHVDDGSQTHDINLTAKEGDAADAHCQTYENVSSTHAVTITETLPTNWDSAANYPTVTGASSVNGMTATLNAGTAPATVTFHNKLNVFSGACYVDGGTFLTTTGPFASTGYWFGLNTYDYFNGDGHNAGLPADPNGATAGNAFDHRWVQVVDNGSGNKLVWKFASGQGSNSVVVYPSVDHNDAGGTTGGSIAGEANEYFVWGSNDGVTWEQASGGSPFDPTPGAYIADNAARVFTFPGGHVWNMIGISVNLGANVGTDAEIDAVCGMSQPLSRKLTVIKDVDNVANDLQTFPIYLDGSQIGSVAETDSPKFSKDISTNSQTFTEGIADGYSYVGGYVSAVDGQCVKPGVEIEDLAQFVIDLLTSTGIKIPEGTDNLTVCLVNHSEKTIKVHITKYLDGKQATAASANNYSFPMSATWSATNIGAGTGSYVLGPAGHGGSGPYAADTSPMTVGASYSTYETLSTSCTAGQPYRLVGYKTDTSGFPTNSSGASTTTPSFTNLQVDQYITVFNESCKGTLYVIKKTQGEPDPHGATFSGTVDSSNSQTWGPLTNGAMSTGISVAAGEHTIQEAPASQDPGLWTAEGLNYATGENHTCPDNPDPALTKPNVPAGGTTYVCIYNLRKAADQLTGTVKVIKTVTGNNPDPNQSFTINVQSGSANLKNNGSATFNFTFSTDSPVWNVTGIGEVNVPANYTLLGYKVINGGVLSCDSDPATLASLIATVPTLEISAQHTAYTVCVYNRGYGSITVTKTTTVNGVVDGTQNAGWKITVSSAACSFNQTQNTNSSGVVAFTNLPTCNDYVVSEDVNSHGNSGFAPVGPSSYGSIAVTAGGNAAVAFTNNRFVPPPCAAFNGCTPVIINTPTTPTATPTTPTATATQPTQKPTEPTKTEKPEEPKTPEPTKTSVVLGEKTPGANATPLAPQTGSGLFGTGKSGSNLLLAVLGIFSLSAGFAVIAVANKNKSRS